MDEESIALAQSFRAECVVRQMSEPAQAVKDADVVYTDTWVGSKGAHAGEAWGIFHAYQINNALIRQAPAHAIVMHCLPAHRGQEITDDVIDGPRSRVLQQANNRLHAQKPVLVHLLSSHEPA